MTLTQKYAIYVPSKDAEGNPIDQDAAVEEVLTWLSKRFGGATAIPGTGAWINENNELVVEKVVVISAYADEYRSADAAAVQKFAQRLQKQLKQESIAYETPAGLEIE